MRKFDELYKGVFEYIINTTGTMPSNLDVLAFILVMEEKDAKDIVELMKEFKEMDTKEVGTAFNPHDIKTD